MTATGAGRQASEADGDGVADPGIDRSDTDVEVEDVIDGTPASTDGAVFLPTPEGQAPDGVPFEAAGSEAPVRDAPKAGAGAIVASGAGCDDDPPDHDSPEDATTPFATTAPLSAPDADRDGEQDLFERVADAVGEFVDVVADPREVVD